MGGSISRADEIAAKLLVAGGLCSQRETDQALRELAELRRQGTNLNLQNLLLKKKNISAMQYRLLNMALRYELDRDEDMSFARFLIKNKYLDVNRVKELLGEQDPYYREGKIFPRLSRLLEEGNCLPRDQIERLRRLFGSAGGGGDARPAAGPPKVGPPPPKRPTVRSDMLVLDHCRVQVKHADVMGPRGDPRKVHVLAVGGQLDAHSFAQFDAFIGRMVEQGRHCLVVEASRLDYISSAGIGVLAGKARLAREHGGDIRLAEVPAGIMSILTLVGFEKLLQIYPTVKQAVDSYKTS
jgi:anti-sigma B factor antagonist